MGGCLQAFLQMRPFLVPARNLGSKGLSERELSPTVIFVTKEASFPSAPSLLSNSGSFRSSAFPLIIRVSLMLDTKKINPIFGFSIIFLCPSISLLPGLSGMNNVF